MPNYHGIEFMEPHKLPLVFEMKPNTEVLVGLWISSKGYSYESS